MKKKIDAIFEVKFNYIIISFKKYISDIHILINNKSLKFEKLIITTKIK